MDALELFAASQEPNVSAFLRALRHGETTQDDEAYRWLFGSTRRSPKLMESFADHPRVRTYEAYDGQFIKNGKIDYTTAAGAYQITETTWNGLARRYGFASFEPQWQDAAAVALILGRGALEDVRAGRFELAVAKCRSEWASLPGATYGQPTVAMSAARAVYENFGGRYADAPAASPAPIPLLLQPETENEPMAPALAIALPALLQAVPALARLFSSGSPTAERNIAATEIAVKVAKDAIGAINEQDLAERIKANPTDAEAVRDAIQANMWRLMDVGGGVPAARDSNVAGAATPWWKQPAMVVTLMLLPLVYLVVYAVIFRDGWSEEMKTMVVTAIVSGVLGSLTGFWLGTSFGSVRKTDMMANKP